MNHFLLRVEHLWNKLLRDLGFKPNYVYRVYSTLHDLNLDCGDLSYNEYRKWLKYIESNFVQAIKKMQGLNEKEIALISEILKEHGKTVEDIILSYNTKLLEIRKMIKDINKESYSQMQQHYKVQRQEIIGIGMTGMRSIQIAKNLEDIGFWRYKQNDPEHPQMAQIPIGFEDYKVIRQAIESINNIDDLKNIVIMIEKQFPGFEICAPITLENYDSFKNALNSVLVIMEGMNFLKAQGVLSGIS